MHIITELSSIPQVNSPSGLTIGSFDGVHLGHQALFQTLRSHLSKNGTLSVLTFSNHPTDIFSHRNPTPMLMTIDHKLKLFQEQGVDLAIVIPFTQKFADQPFEDFLTDLKRKLNFIHLTLGAGASFGKNRQGDENHVRALSHSLDFQAEYLPKIMIDGHPVSSGRIRAHLAQGELQAVNALLGRPYSIYTSLIQTDQAFEATLPGLCLPPNGTYPIQLNLSGKLLLGSANINQASASVRLELSHPDCTPLNSKHLAEIIFL